MRKPDPDTASLWPAGGPVSAASVTPVKPQPASPAGRSPAAQPTHQRHDVLTGRWTLFADARDRRPNDFKAPAAASGDGSQETGDCPFCRGNEQCTPDPVMSVSQVPDAEESASACGDADRWVLRVVPNKFPAVDPLVDAGESQRRSNDADQGTPDTAATSPLFRSRPLRGGHEVFVESPHHFASLAELDVAQVVALLQLYGARLRHWSRQPGIRFISLFKNVGPKAGASLRHPHSQLIAMTELPQMVRAMVDRMRLHHARSGCCLHCDILRAELKSKQRVVAVSDHLVAYCPYASHLPMMMRITTGEHIERFEDLGIAALTDLARLLRRAIGWLQKLYPDVDYNFLLHTRPPGMADDDGFHWSLELFPRLNHVAGFEWSCDMMINPMPPELAAVRLRQVALDENPLR